MPRPKSSTKVKYLLSLEPHVKKTLNLLAREYEVPISDIIEALVTVANAVNPSLFGQAVVGVRDRMAAYVPGDDEAAARMLARHLVVQRLKKKGEMYDDLYGELPEK